MFMADPEAPGLICTALQHSKTSAADYEKSHQVGKGDKLNLEEAKEMGFDLAKGVH